MMLPPYTYAAGRLAEERAQDVMREGEHARLVRAARLVKPGPMDRFLARLGNMLVTNGERLRARCTPNTTNMADSPLEARQ